MSICCDCCTCPWEKDKYCCLGCYAWCGDRQGEESCLCCGLGGVNRYMENEKAGIGLWCCLGLCLVVLSRTIDVAPSPPKLTNSVEVCTPCTCVTFKKEGQRHEIDIKSPCCGFQKVVSKHAVSGAPRESGQLSDPLNSVD